VYPKFIRRHSLPGRLGSLSPSKAIQLGAAREREERKREREEREREEREREEREREERVRNLERSGGSSMESRLPCRRSRCSAGGTSSV
jgi:hypothetical protein